MPREIVHIDLSAELAARPQPTFTDAGVVGFATEEPPDAEFDEAYRYDSAADVSNDFGESSDVFTASQAIEEMGASFWYVMVLEVEEHVDEELDETGELEYTPVHPDFDIETDAEQEITFVTDDPPEDPAEDELLVNPDTGEYASSEASDTITYYTVNLSDGLVEFETNVNRLALADIRSEQGHVGLLNAAQSWASSQDVAMLANGPNMNEYDSRADAMEVAHDVAAYIPSGDFAMLINEGSQDLASYMVGNLAVNDPWHNFYWDELPVSDPVKRLVGGPETPDTLEGGRDAGGDTGEGPVNALIQVAGANRMSNSLTTAGAGSDYQFFDIRTTMNFLKAEITRALENLRARKNRIPFTDSGREVIKNVVTDTVEQYVDDEDGPLSEADVFVPSHEDLTEDDRANRHWTGIEVDATLAGDVHEFSLKLTVGV